MFSIRINSERKCVLCSLHCSLKLNSEIYIDKTGLLTYTNRVMKNINV